MKMMNNIKKLRWTMSMLTLSYMLTASAQSETSAADSTVNNATISQHAMTFGVGSSSLLDTYLSPIEYQGEEMRFQRETFRMTRLAHGRIATQTIFNFNLASTTNKAETGDQFASNISYSVGWLYKMPVARGLNIYAGPLVEGSVGVIYNDRNSNNPAQAKAFANITASAKAVYNFNMFKLPFSLNYQLSAPLVGVMFQPEYEQSYYEMFALGHSDGIVHFTTPATQPTLRHTLMLDVPVGRWTMRVGYLGYFDQTKVGQLKWHSYSNAFMIGYVKTIELIRSHRSRHIF